MASRRRGRGQRSPSESFQEERPERASIIPKPVVQPKEYVAGSSWYEYLSYFNNVSLINGWSDYDKARFLSICLTGEYLDLFNSITDEDIKGSYDLLSAALTAKIDPPERREIKKDAFYSRKQLTTESLSFFAASLGKMFAEAFPKANKEQKDEALRDRFLKGILNKDIRLQVALSRPDSFEATLTRALQVETALAVHGHGHSSSSISEINGESDSGQIKESINAVESVQIQELREAVNKLTEQLKNSSQYKLKPRFQNSRASTNIVCWGCGMKGHFKRLCPTIRKGN